MQPAPEGRGYLPWFCLSASLNWEVLLLLTYSSIELQKVNLFSLFLKSAVK